MGAAKQGKKQSKVTQITRIKSQITPMRIVWRFAHKGIQMPREAHSIPFRVICDLIRVICVELACFLPSPPVALSLLRPIDAIDNREKSLHTIPSVLQGVVCYRARAFALDVFGDDRHQIVGSCSATITPRQIKATGAD